MHILIVEDRPVYSDRWKHFLRYQGCSVVLATTVTEALAELKARTPDLIICDNDINPCAIYDDRLDGGFFFITKARENQYAGRIIFYTRGKRDYFTGELDITPLNVRYIWKQRKTPYTRMINRRSVL